MAQFTTDTRLYFFKSEHERESVSQTRTQLEKEYAGQKTSDINQAHIVVALGGDGTFLEAQRLMAATPSSKAALLGMAYGTVNYLMNKGQYLPTLVNESYRVETHPLIVSYSQGNGIYHTEHAFNEVVLHRIDPHNQTCHLNIQTNNLYGSTNGDGILTTTPQGWHGYHYQAGGKFIPLWSGKVGLQPICDRSAKSLSRLIPDTQRITIEVEDFHKRPVVLNTDNNLAIKNVVRCTVEMDYSISVPVLWSKTAPIMMQNLQRLQHRTKIAAHQRPFLKKISAQHQYC